MALRSSQPYDSNKITDIFPKKHVRLHRKDIVDILYSNRNSIRFHIYGPPKLYDLYPECYRGFVKYEDCPKVFSNSKISLCIHATSFNNYGKYLYFSERLPQILASYGLLYTDTIYDGLLVPDMNYILADPINPLEQINNIIKSYNSHKYQQIKKNGYETAIKYMTWNNMLDKIDYISNS